MFQAGDAPRGMPTLQSLMALVGQPIAAAEVQALIVADGLISSTEEDLQEGVVPRGYLSSPANGYALSHVSGRLDTAFVFLVPVHECQAFSQELIAGLAGSSTRTDVRRALGLPAKSGEVKSVPALGLMGAWDRYNLGSLCLHFEYTTQDERLRQVTVMTTDTAP